MSVSILQSGNANVLSGQTSVSFTPPSAFTAGSLILLCGNQFTTLTPSASDTTNGNYSRITVNEEGTTGNAMGLFYFVNSAAARPTVSVSGFIASTGGIVWAELAGGVSAIDQSTTATNGASKTASLTVGPITTTQAHEVVIVGAACVSGGQTFSGVTTGYTTAKIATLSLGGAAIIAYKELLTTHSISGTANQSTGTDQMGAVIASFVLPSPVTTNWLSGQREFINKHNR